MEGKKNLILAAIKRAGNKLHSSKIVKKLAALTLATAISIGGLAACGPTQNPDNPTPSTDICTDCGGNHKTEDHNKNHEQEEQKSLKQYSKLIQTLFTDPYFSKAGQDIVNDIKLVATDPRFDPHPYSFFAQQGHDVQQIQEEISQGVEKCLTYGFIYDDEPNNLYIATRLADPTNTFYYEYLLKYELTEHEMKDYKWMHGVGMKDINGKKQFTQFFLLNDIVAKTHTPTILGSTMVTIESHEKFAQYDNHNARNLLWNPLDLAKNQSTEAYWDFIIQSAKQEGKFKDYGRMHVFLFQGLKGTYGSPAHPCKVKTVFVNLSDMFLGSPCANGSYDLVDTTFNSYYSKTDKTNWPTIRYATKFADEYIGLDQYDYDEHLLWRPFKLNNAEIEQEYKNYEPNSTKKLT